MNKKVIVLLLNSIIIHYRSKVVKQGFLKCFWKKSLNLIKYFSKKKYSKTV